MIELPPNYSDDNIGAKLKAFLSMKISHTPLRVTNGSILPSSGPVRINW